MSTATHATILLQCLVVHYTASQPSPICGKLPPCAAAPFFACRFNFWLALLLAFCRAADPATDARLAASARILETTRLHLLEATSNFHVRSAGKVREGPAERNPQNALLKATAAVPARGPDGQLDVKALPRAAAVAEEKPGNALARCVSSAAAARVTSAARVTTATIAPKLEITAAKRGRKFKEGDEEFTPQPLCLRAWGCSAGVGTPDVRNPAICNLICGQNRTSHVIV
jgi:hypothetical protein